MKLTCIVMLITGVLQFGSEEVLAEPSVMLGILENHYAVSEINPPSDGVRVAFKKEGEEWVSFKNDCNDKKCLQSAIKEFPEAMSWTIAFDGKKIGELSSRNPLELKTYSKIGLQDVEKPKSIPRIGKPSLEFAGFIYEKVYRPLVVVSKPNFTDPDKWKPFKPDSNLQKKLRTSFRAKFPKAMNCKVVNDVKSQPWNYLDSDIAIHKSYASKNGTVIASVALLGFKCDGIADQEFRDNWFVVRKDKDPEYLGADLVLLDAGDYDGSGKSSLIFLIDGYNRGGYKIYYDDFKKSAVFTYVFH